MNGDLSGESPSLTVAAHDAAERINQFARCRANRHCRATDSAARRRQPCPCMCTGTRAKDTPTPS